MNKSIALWIGRIGVLIIVVALLVGMPSAIFQTNAAPPPDGGIPGMVYSQVSTAVQAAPALYTPQWVSEMPQPTESQRAQIARGEAMSNLPGPTGATSPVSVPAPDPKTQSRLISFNSSNPSNPTVPGDPIIFRSSAFGGTIPDGYKSNVMESSLGQSGRVIFFTGTWFAARSITGGSNWQYVNIFSDMPSVCCNQIVLYDGARNLWLWYRQGLADSNGVNIFRLGVSTNNGASWCNYDVAPTSTNGAWTNQWWQDPNMQLGANYVYIASNMFNQGGSWTRSVMLRWPLDSLQTCSGFSYSYNAATDWFTIVPVSGADHVMYFASNWPTTSPYNRLAIWKWDEVSNSLGAITPTIGDWTRTSSLCGASSGNWMGRSDYRLQTGARYMIHGTDVSYPGRKVLGWWWNVAQGGSFTQPYVEAAAFFEDTLAQVSGNQGRPLLWGGYCFGYPDATPNIRGDLGLVFDYAQSSDSWKPRIGYTFADDYSPAPGNWTFYYAGGSNARPSDNRWGDYNTVRKYEPSGRIWVAGMHYIANSTDCSSCSQPYYFAFGRTRDLPSFSTWIDSPGGSLYMPFMTR